MKSRESFRLSVSAGLAVAAGLILGGCASSGSKSSGGSSEPPSHSRFVATDGRTIEIGKSTSTNGGSCYNNPHMEKGKCWVASRFDFKGYDTLYIAPTLSTAKYPEKPEDKKVHDLAKENLVIELTRMITARQLFANVVTRESDIKPGTAVLKLENTITEFNKGGGAARYFAGLYGGGQPVLRVQGKMGEGEKIMFTYEARRSGTSAGARLGGVYMKDEDIQIEDIRSMVLDLTDFMSAIAGRYQPKS
jgi:hypothetical protein